MGGTIPFAFQKGSWKYFEDLFNKGISLTPPAGNPTPPYLYNTSSVGSLDDLKKFRLRSLINMYKSRSIFGTNFPYVQTYTTNPLGKMENHSKIDWLGYESDANGDAIGNPGVDAYRNYPNPANEPKPAGESMRKWVSYWGDVENILRITFMTALCVSLGISGNGVFKPALDPANLNADADIPFADLGIDLTLDADEIEFQEDVLQRLKCWPIEIYHVCGIPWLSGFVGWRNLDAQGSLWAADSDSKTRPSGFVVVTIVGPSQVDPYAGISGGSTITGVPPSQKSAVDSGYGIPLMANAAIPIAPGTVDLPAGLCVVTHDSHEISAPANTVEVMTASLEEALHVLEGTESQPVNNRWSSPLPTYHPRFDNVSNADGSNRRSLIGVGPVNLPKFDGGIL